MYSGQIASRGPRYCPSIEDKIVRFGERDGHQIFLEPEGLDDTTVYPNGISTSLPEDVQLALVATIPGLERAKHGRARATRSNTTTSIRASCGRRWKPSAFPGFSWPARSTARPDTRRPPPRAWWRGSTPPRGRARAATIVFDRAEGYLGVMIDDLVTRGVTEPYRMFTSRAEYRLTLRADNADQRLTPKGHRHRLRRRRARAAIRAPRCRRWTTARGFGPLAFGHAERSRAPRHRAQSGRPAPHRVRAAVVSDLQNGRSRHGFGRSSGRLTAKIAEQLETDAKYAVYLDRQAADVASYRRDEAFELPDDLDYAALDRAFERGPPEAPGQTPAHHRPGQPDRRHYAGGAHAARCPRSPPR